MNILILLLNLSIQKIVSPYALTKSLQTLINYYDFTLGLLGMAFSQGTLVWHSPQLGVVTS